MSQQDTHVWAVVPVKRFADAKRRLAAWLRNDQRELLAQTMLRDVLATLTQCCSLSGIIAVTPDAEAARIAASARAHVLPDCGGGLNGAILTAAAHIQKHIGAAALLVVPGDVPHVSVHTLDAAIDALRRPGSAVLAEATRDGGTNLFGCNPASALAPGFGPGSFARHSAAAETAGLRVHSVARSELHLDLDEPADLSAFMAFDSQTQTAALLSGWDIAGLPSSAENAGAISFYPPYCGEGRRAKHVGVAVVEIIAEPPPPPTPPHKREGSPPHRLRVRV